MDIVTSKDLTIERFVKQVSNGCARSKYSYLAMQSDNEIAFKRAKWKKAACRLEEVTCCVNKVTETDRVVDAETGAIIVPESFKAFIDDKYDAFKQAGDAVNVSATMCAYAGMAAYRITLHKNLLDNLHSLRFLVSIDRYLRSGVKVRSVVSRHDDLKDIEIPGGTWSYTNYQTNYFDNAFVDEHASEQVAAEGMKWKGIGNNAECNYLLQSKAKEIQVEIPAHDIPIIEDGVLGDESKKCYLWIVIALEDYNDYWDKYSANEARFYSIEGSAHIVPSSIELVLSYLYNQYLVDYSRWVSTNRHPALTALNQDFMQREMAKVEADTPEEKLNAVIAKYGNFCTATSTAIFNMPFRYINENMHDSRFESIAQLMQFDKGGLAAGQITDGNVKISEIGKFGICSADWNVYNSIPESDFWDNGRKSVSEHIVGFQINYPGLQNGYVDGDRYINPCSIRFRSAIFVVPYGKSEYFKMKLPCVREYASDPKKTFNLWRTKSEDAKGVWALPAISSLLAKPDLYTSKLQKLTSSITGSGADTGQMELNIVADLVARFEVETASDYDLFVEPQNPHFTVKLIKQVHPGDVLVMSYCDPYFPIGFDDWDPGENYTGFRTVENGFAIYEFA